LTVTFLVAVLLLLFRSCVLAPTVAVFDNWVPEEAVTVTVMPMLALAPLARLPRFTVTVPLLPVGGALMLDPVGAVALANVVPGGNASVTTTFVAMAFPPLLTVNEYTSEPPVAGLAGAACMLIPRSAAVWPPPPPAATLYATTVFDELPTVSDATTVNVFAPVDDVLNGNPFATVP
jgi:hypothetical protein